METKQNTLQLPFFILFALFSLSFSTFAQTGSLKGTVSSIKEPKLFSASIALFNEKNTLVKAVLSDTEGAFTITRLSAGTYSLKITMVGYEDKIVPGITITDSIVNLGTTTLNESAVQLNEVVVKKEKPLVQVLADKTVFNVENTINATGNTGFELLRKAPGVVVDNNDNVIV